MIEHSNTAGNPFHLKIKYQIAEGLTVLFAGLGLIEIGMEFYDRYFQAGEDPVSVKSIGLTACLGLFSYAARESAQDYKANIKKLEEPGSGS